MVNADPAWCHQLLSQILNGFPLTVLLCAVGNTSKSLTGSSQTISGIIEIMVQLLQQACVYFELVVDLRRQVTLTRNRP